MSMNAPQEVYTEAYGHLCDCFEDVPDYLSYEECEAAINKYYVGGWPEFVKSCGALLS